MNNKLMFVVYCAAALNLTVGSWLKSLIILRKRWF